MDSLTTTGTRSAVAAEMEHWGLAREEAEAEFDKWLAGVKAHAWDEGFDVGRDDLGAADVARDHGEDENPYYVKEA